ncbi:MAG TPA: DUF1565 domain-containing protein [Verrucomicrobiae bacterium]|nr:DUF1565 domain-containing protein [Verrucomicrobiae bacterium]
MKRILLCLGFVLTVFSASGAVLYVRADASGAETNGFSWATAFKTITEALQYAATGDELWVAAGNYRGTIDVRAGVALYGGFAGNETARTQRNWSLHKSVIDWELWGDISVFFNEKFGPAVLLGGGSRLDGFTVVNGWHSHGAGIYATDSGATIANNVIVTNRAIGILPSAILVDRSGQFNVANDFFLKTANDLLHLQFPFGATNIPVAQYGPGVHRMLQVAANVYDAARSNTFPSVFRPQFDSTPDGPIISGYYEDNSATNVIQWLTANPYGVPMIIGARKGFPNFNELMIESIVSAARRLEMRRQTTNSRPNQTNEMYILGIENRVGLEAWNSYTNAISNRVDVAIGNHLTISITNSDGLIFSTNNVFSVATSYQTWPGFVSPNVPSSANVLSFKVPLYTNTTTLSNGIYRAGLPGSVEPSGYTNQFVANSGFHIPEWTLTVSNNLVFVLQSGGRIIDFVDLMLTNSLGLTTNFFNVNAAAPSASEGPVALCWSTNRPGTSVYVPTEGVQRQIDISLEQVAISAQQWADYANVNDSKSAITNFNFFVFPDRYASGNNNNTNLVQQVPFAPARKMIISARWEANDPLVHALPEHLKDLTNNVVRYMVRPFLAVPLTNQTLSQVNIRYRPWGGRPGTSGYAEAYDRRLKDAAVWNANDFDFPTGRNVNIDWLDRIHRGTPWQTLYFDGDVAPMDTWVRQLADSATHPTNDWKIIDYLRRQLTFSGLPTPTRVVNNTIVGNDGGLWIATNAGTSVMNNALAYNSAGIVDEGGASVELSHNCVSCSPQFVNPIAGDLSLLATSPLIDAGDGSALAFLERPIYGSGPDIGALEFGPDGVPVFTFHPTSPTAYELNLRGFPGQSYIVEASTNLADWGPITTNIALMGNVLIQDAAGTNYPHRFYRAKVANHPN